MFFDQHKAILSQNLIENSPERVDLATRDSAQYITQHIQLNLQHVYSRGRMRLITLKFGILSGHRTLCDFLSLGWSKTLRLYYSSLLGTRSFLLKEKACKVSFAQSRYALVLSRITQSGQFLCTT